MCQQDKSSVKQKSLISHLPCSRFLHIQFKLSSFSTTFMLHLQNSAVLAECFYAGVE